MSESKKYAAIRYGQFTDSWELKKLGDLASSFEYGLNAAAKEFDGVNKYLRITDINENSREFVKEGLTSPDIELDKADNYLLSKGDILFARTGASVGKTYRYRETDGKVYYAGFLIRAHINEENDSEFVYQNTLTDAYNNFIKKTSQRSGQPGVNAQEYASFKLEVPSKEEQVKIGEFFIKIDELITLQQLKYEKTVNMKKAILEKMFPKNGEDKPEIRFKEFTDAWVLCKLSDVKDVRDGTHDSPKYVPKGHPLVTSKNLKESGLDMTEITLISTDDFIAINKRSKVDIGDILFGMIGTIGNPVIVDIDGFAIKNVALIKSGGAVSNIFLIQLLKSSVFDKYIRNENVGNTQKFLGLSKIRDFKFHIPSFAEQEKIGMFFKQLDSTITLHKRELEKMKNIKKALVQKMLV